MDHGLAVSRLPTDLHTRWPGTFQMKAAHHRHRQLQQRGDLLLGQQAFVIAHQAAGHAALHSVNCT
jgi:hypothetical protein